MANRNSRFQVGRAYQNHAGMQMYIAGAVDTIVYGVTLIAENGWNREALKCAQYKYDHHTGEDKISSTRPGSEGWNNLSPVSIANDAKENWFEIPVEEYIRNNTSQ